MLLKNAHNFKIQIVRLVLIVEKRYACRIPAMPRVPFLHSICHNRTLFLPNIIESLDTFLLSDVINTFDFQGRPSI